ncbi:MAG: tyrosine-type recombinase/integrase [Candidatus Aureabacteria bacterium]|nr:tyrosine-type recombinase/integrase [Candidatus Auribacterota bacterium]
MRDELISIRRGEVLEYPQGRIDELLNAFLSRRSETTRKAYQTDLQDFAKYTESEDLKSAVMGLVSQGPGRANSIALQYKGSMIHAGKTPATVNRRLSALRSVISLAKTLGIISWTLEVPNEKAKACRDTRGPGRHGVKALYDAIEGASPKGKRDKAIIRLMYDLGLRRGEVASLSLENVDLEGKRAWIQGKGRSGEREAITLPEQTIEALRQWLEVRGQDPGPLFTNYAHFSKGEGLTGTGLWYIVRRLGERAGLVTRPHGIRHASITEALEVTKDPRAVQRFSRHRDLETLMRYDDNREDLGGKVAEAVASGL